jgi:hypothetical protein
MPGVCLWMDPAVTEATTESSTLPVRVYEASFALTFSGTSEEAISFTTVPFDIDAAAAERIALDDVFHATPDTGVPVPGAEAMAHLGNQRNAIAMLQQRLRVVLDYLNSVQSGSLPADAQVLQQVRNLCMQLPVLGHGSVTSAASTPSMMAGEEPTLILTYLTQVVKNVQAMQTLHENLAPSAVERDELMDRFPGHGGRGSKGSRSFGKDARMMMGFDADDFGSGRQERSSRRPMIRSSRSGGSGGSSRAGDA